MSEELLFEIPDDAMWDEEDEIEEVGSGKRRFAKARLYYPLHVERYVKVEAGGVFTLPGVFYDKFDQTTQTSERVGLKEFRGMKLNSKAKSTMVLFVFEFTDQHGKPYQRHLKMGLWEEKDDDGNVRPNLWRESQKSEVAKLSTAERVALTKAAVADDWKYVSYTETPTGYTYEYDPKSYAADIVLYKTEAEWKAASEAYFAQFSQNGSTPDSHYPEVWGDSIEAMLEHAKGLKDKPHAEIAKELMLFDDNGNPALTANGEAVNVTGILAEALDMPEPMIKL